MQRNNVEEISRMARTTEKKHNSKKLGGEGGREGSPLDMPTECKSIFGHKKSIAFPWLLAFYVSHKARFV